MKKLPFQAAILVGMFAFASLGLAQSQTPSKGTLTPGSGTLPITPTVPSTIAPNTTSPAVPSTTTPKTPLPSPSPRTVPPSSGAITIPSTPIPSTGSSPSTQPSSGTVPQGSVIYPQVSPLGSPTSPGGAVIVTPVQ